MYHSALPTQRDMSTKRLRLQKRSDFVNTVNTVDLPISRPRKPGRNSANPFLNTVDSSELTAASALSRRHETETNERVSFLSIGLCALSKKNCYLSLSTAIRSRAAEFTCVSHGHVHQSRVFEPAHDVGTLESEPAIMLFSS